LTAFGTVRISAVRIGERHDSRHTDGSQPIEGIGIVQVQGFRTDRIAIVHVGANRPANRIDLRHLAERRLIATRQINGEFAR
jgi:hypothetical protein